MSTSPSPRTAVIGLTVGALAASGVALAAPASAAPTDARITEIHYDNAGDDTGEAIEVTAPATADLAGLQVVLYNGNGGAAYGTRTIGEGDVRAEGIAVLDYPLNGIQNGSPDGMALVTPDGTVVEFLSYEGAFTAAGGPADGLRSTDIGVEESGTTPVGQSLQRTPGSDEWFGPVAETFGAPNSGDAPADPDPVDPDPVDPGPGDDGPGDDGDVAPACDTEARPIGEVQGDGAASPLVGQTVTVGGTVVGDVQEGLGGVYLQDAGDGRPQTSDGVFVFAPAGPELELGDRLVVQGTVEESFGQTQLADVVLVECGTGELPAPATLELPSDVAEREALEGMSVVLAAEELTVTEVFNLNRFGELQLAEGGRLVQPTETAEPGSPGAQAIVAENAERSILLDDGSDSRLDTNDLAPPYLTVDDPVRVGDTVTTLEPQVLGFGFGAYRLHPADGAPDGNAFAPTNPRPEAPASVGGDLRVADFNVLNYFTTLGLRGAETAEEFERQEAKIVTALVDLDADIVTLHEIENSSVTTPATPYRAVETLVAAVNEAAGTDAWTYVAASDDSDQITNAIIYRTDRVTAVGDPAVPADPTDAFANGRLPIAQAFDAGGEVFTVITNHFKSKGSACGAGSDDPSVGGAGNCNGDRVDQARVLVDFAAEMAERAGDTDVLITGDLNSYRQEDPLDVVREAGYLDLTAELAAAGEYSYVFGGASGSLDHAFASPELAGKVSGATIWDINAVESFAYQYDGFDGLYAPYAFRSSDHDPIVLGLDTAGAAQQPAAELSDDEPRRGDRVSVIGTGFAPGAVVQASVPSGRGGSPDVVLGRAVAGDDGTAEIAFRVPARLPAGEHTVTLTADDGTTATASFTLGRPGGGPPNR